MLESWTARTFEPHVGSEFQVQGASIALRLTEVQESAPHVRAGTRTPFLLLLHSPGNQYLGQGTYVLQHDRLGTLALFIVPLGPADGGMKYQAVFT